MRVYKHMHYLRNSSRRRKQEKNNKFDHIIIF